MSDERDFELDAADLSSAAEGPEEASAHADGAPDAAPDLAPALPPRVVIQYRSQGLSRSLLPPLLIALMALVILSYQRQARLRLPAAPPKSAATTGVAGPGRTIVVEPSGTGAAVGPIMVRAETPLPPPPPPTPPPTPEPDAPAVPSTAEALAHVEDQATSGPSSASDLDAPGGPSPPIPSVAGRKIAAGPPLEPPEPPRSAVGERLSPDSPELAFRVVAEPAQAASATAPEPEPRLTKEQILQGIQAESQQKKAEQRNLAREVVLSKVREYQELFQKMNADRPTFHDDLRGLVRRLGDGAGEEINLLCDRYGRTLLPEVEKTLGLAMKRKGAMFSRGRRIEMMRAYGVPEAAVLDSLWKEMELRIKTRGGPRDKNEALVDAAYLLLRYPPARPAERPPTAAPDRAPTAAPRSMAGVAAPPAPRAVRRPQ